ncbi:regulatory protein, luxR family [Nocardioides exalbidus]|uniref:Regulatory protein, luxR family n=1 Tax=Nocardioides exalbidus TaxID=402596 RepID=A0A1H4N9T4_9ACTN|nr:LuxR C-terminal-related transcriptional regulator [Nocardioides exalbidus]SEB91518.1 regulatory protein, luxR family [Nocardioides exalbidus]
MTDAREVVPADDELRVLRLMAEGDTIDVVARKLEISERTVRRKARSACDTLGCETTIEAIVWAVRRGLV